MIPDYVRDIQVSLKNKCYYSALSLALALPDICGCAEYPNKSVAERYITWYDDMLGNEAKQQRNGNEPWLSGELVYNLRNTFLHAGSPNIIVNKVKEPDNQIDRFVLLLDDGSVLWEASLNGYCMFDNTKVKFLIIDITHLCLIISYAALHHYSTNAEKYSFKFYTVTKENLMSAAAVDESLTIQDKVKELLAALLNEKLEEEGST